MSSIEERLVRDIAAVTGGVVVTDSDLRDARAAVDERIETRRQRDRRRSVIAAAAAAVVALVVGIVAFRAFDSDDLSAPPANPAPSTNDPYQDFLLGPAPTADDVRGVWRVSNDFLVRFSSPNRVSIDERGRMFDNPDVQGTYEITGREITISVTGGRDGCAGQELVMRASIPERHVMRVVLTGPGAGDCFRTPSFTWTLEQVAMAGPFLASLDDYSASDWQPLPTDTRLNGSWFAEGGGYYLELARSGAYYVADDSGDAVDQGQWSRRGSGLTLTSSGSTTCDEGDRLVLRDVEVVSPGTTVMRPTVRENSCGAPWAGKGWILIPYPGS